MLRTKFALVGTIGLTLLLAAPSALAQIPDPVAAVEVPTPGSGHNYIGSATETVNPADGSLSFDLPLPTPPGRGISFPLSIHYNSGLQYYLTSDSNSGSTFPALNWALLPQPYSLFTVPFLSFRAEIQNAQYIPSPGSQGQTFTYEQCDFTTNFIFRGLDGVQYPLGQVGATWSEEDPSPGGPQDPNCVYSPPGGGTWHGILVTPGTQDPNFNYGQPEMVITDASGTTYHFPAVPIGTVNTFLTPFASPETVLPDIITDRNGNQLKFAFVGPNAGEYIDALGRPVVSWNTGGSGPASFSVSGFGNVSITSTTSSGNVTFPGTITDTSHSNQACTKNSTQPFASTYTDQSVITLPNGDKYTLSFDPGFGQINKIVYPSGGYIVYTWGPTSDPSSAPLSDGLAKYQFTSDNQVFQVSCTYEYQTPAIIARDVYNGGQHVLHQSFAYTTTTASGQWSSRKTLVTTQDLVANQTTHTEYNYEPIVADNENTSAVFGPNVPVETSIKYENSNQTVLKEVHKTWADARNVIGEQTILYDPQGANPQGSARQYCYDTNEQLVGLYEYDYQSQGPKTNDPDCYSYAFKYGSNAFGTDPGLINSLIGPMKRNTVTIWHNFGSTHITNEPDSVGVFDGSSNTNPVRQLTVDNYDQGTVVSSPVPVSPTLGTLVSPPGQRGNATSITRWANMGPSEKTTYGYYETGQLAWKVDPCGNTTCPDIPVSNNFKTTYVYTDPGSWDPNGNSDAYLTSITDPLGHVRSFSYDYSSGKLTSSTDEYVSGVTPNTTTYKYNTQAQQCTTTDGLDRLTEIDYPDGGVISYCYNDAVPSKTTNQLLSGSTWKTSTSTMDGFGRVIKNQLQVGPGVFDYTGTSYTGLGQLYQAWNPSHCDPAAGSGCGGETTWGITTYGYDPLGRKSSQANSDGTSSESWSYNANLVTFTDENMNQWQQTTDGLGRLIAVQEPDGTNHTASMETDYTYDDNDNLIQVDQYGGVKGGTGQTEVKRTFNYDSLSRLICASNPESATNPQNLTNFTPVVCPSSATATYTIGTLGYTYDANGNLQSREDARGVTTTYGYDPLDRVVSKSYSDNGVTPSVSFTYDAGVLGISNGNYVGRLAQAETVSNNSVVYNYSTLGYDAVGRPLGYLECPAGANCLSGASTVVGANYHYDLAGNITQVMSQGTIASNGSTVGGVNQRNYTYDTAAQLLTVTADARTVGGLDAGLVTLFNSPTYNAAGQLTAAALNPTSQQSTIGLTRTYDNRLRPLSESDTGQVGTPGTPATVTVSVTGTEGSIGGSGTPTQATGTISLSYSGGQQAMQHAIPLFASSSITLPDGYRAPFVASMNSALATANTLAGILNSAFSPVTAVVASGGSARAASVLLTTKATGADENGAITLSLVATQVKAAPASLSGGAGTTYDTGTVTANVNGTAVTASYGQTSTPQSLAAALATAITGAGAGVTATAGPSGTITVTANLAGTADNGWPVTLSSATDQPKWFSSPSFSGTSGALGGGAGGTLSPGTIYSYSIPSPSTANTGYAGNGNLLSFTDSVNGQWTQIGYDTLNRITAATVAGTPSTTLTWSYDPFGNRKQQGPNGGTSTYPPGNNRISGFSYEASGNVKDDGSNQYVYDGEGRICTVYNRTMTSYTSYAYDGLGNRVAKGGGANGLSCDNNLTVTSTFIVGPNGEQLDALNANGAAYSNVFANGNLLATYQFPTSNWTYALNDWLGTKRFVANAEGALAETCTGLPFGDGLNCTGPGADPSPQHFTGKERDAESGNDYFPARYYASAMGRWMSPDPIPWLGWQHPPEGSSEEEEEESHKKFEEWISDPQNFNMYAYVNNNPLRSTDPTGMAGCTAGDKTFSTCTITITYDPKTSQGTLTVTGQNKGDKEATTLLTASVVVGGDGHVTPTGTFTAKSWEKDHVSTLYGNAANTPWSKTLLGGNAFGPYQLHIKELDGRGIMIHGTMGPSWSTKTWGNAIFLSPTSHGCIRMCNADDINLHNMMPNPSGNKIVINTTP